MSTRSVVSYDDITLPYEEQDKPSSSSHAGRPPPAKKRKKNNNQRAQHHGGSHSNRSKTPRNASNSQSTEFKKYMNAAFGFNETRQRQQEDSYEGDTVLSEEGEYEEEEESGDLTHEEIWDDSALVDAWDAAMEEYEAYHGLEKDWKKEPVQKSPLWYNIPVDPSKRNANLSSSKSKVPSINTLSGPDATENKYTEPDTKPLDFNTFVPLHDPSLESSFTPFPDTPAGPMVSQDEAFQRAQNAMYWGGYWTAMYHCQQQLAAQASAGNDEDDAGGEEVPAGEEEEEEEEIEIDEDGDFISTQR